MKYNGKAFRPQDLKKEGSQFAGWQLNGAIYDFTQLVTESITLTALWQKEGDTPSPTPTPAPTPNPNAVESAWLAQVRIVDNPFTVKLTLEGVERAERVEVYSLDGVEMCSQLLQGQSCVELATSQWPTGIYIVRLVAADGVKAMKVLKR